MKKLTFLTILFTALLVSGSAWADILTVGTGGNYSTLSGTNGALAAAQAGDEIQLVSNLTENASLYFDKQLTLNLQQFILTFKYNFMLNNGADLTIKATTGGITHSSYYTISFTTTGTSNTATLTILSGVFNTQIDATGYSNKRVYNVNIEGGTFNKKVNASSLNNLHVTGGTFNAQFTIASPYTEYYFEGGLYTYVPSLTSGTQSKCYYNGPSGKTAIDGHNTTDFFFVNANGYFELAAGNAFPSYEALAGTTASKMYKCVSLVGAFSSANFGKQLTRFDLNEGVTSDADMVLPSVSMPSAITVLATQTGSSYIGKVNLSTYYNSSSYSFKYICRNDDENFPEVTAPSGYYINIGSAAYAYADNCTQYTMYAVSGSGDVKVGNMGFATISNAYFAIEHGFTNNVNVIKPQKALDQQTLIINVDDQSAIIDFNGYTLSFNGYGRSLDYETAITFIDSSVGKTGKQDKGSTFYGDYDFFNVVIKGGTWPFDPSNYLRAGASDPINFVPAGYEVITLPDDWWLVQEIVIAAKIGDVEYSSVAAAIAAATEPDVVVLLQNSTENLTITKNVTIDLAGYTLSGAITNSANLTIKSENVKTGSLTGEITNTGNLYITSGTYACETWPAGTQISGGTYIYDPTSYLASGCIVIGTTSPYTVTNGVITNGEEVEITENKSLTNLTINEGGDVSITENHTLTVDNFIIKASHTGVDGQSSSGKLSGTGEISVNDDVYYEVNLAAGADAFDRTLYYSVAVPFKVSVTDGVYGVNAQGGAIKIDKSYYKIWKYDGAIRAAQGPVDACWVELTSGNMEPGVFYLMAFGMDTYSVFRFKKVAGEQINNAVTSVSCVDYTSTTGDQTDGGWNGLANSGLYYISSNESQDVYIQVYNNKENTFTTVKFNTNDLVVGCPYFYQAPNGTTSISVQESTGGTGKYAPSRGSVASLTYALSIRQKGLGYFEDKLFLSCTEDAQDQYVIGSDLLKMFMGKATVAQMWVNAYGHKLSVNNAPSVDNIATFDLTLYAANEGDYELSLEELATDGSEMFLMYNNQIIANLNKGTFVAHLNKGENKDYSVRIRKITDISTKINKAEASQGIQKIISNGNVIIIRNGIKYNIVGSKL